MKPDIEPMLTMAPDPASSMCWPKARQHQKVPLRLTSMTFSQCSSVTFSAGVSLRAMPALLTRMSILPCRVASSVRDLGDARGIGDVHDDASAA